MEIFWDGFDKYAPLNAYTTSSTLGCEWTSPPTGSAIFVAGRFSGSLALQLMYGTTMSRTLPNNYPRLIGGIAMQPTLSGYCGVEAQLRYR